MHKYFSLVYAQMLRLRQSLIWKNILGIADFRNNIIYLAFCWLLPTGMHVYLSFVLFILLSFLQIFYCVFCVGAQLY